MKQQKNQFKKFSTLVKQHVADIFTRYNQEVQRRNDEQIGGILHKNDKSQKIYSQLQQVVRDLRTIQKELHDCEKLRKERRELFEKRTNKYLNTLQLLLQDKNIRIKITSHLEKIVVRARDNVQEVQTALRRYKTQSLSLCGKSYDYKPMVEQTFMELSEMAFMWEHIPNFQSVTNESVKEIFIPIAYRPSDHQHLESELTRTWNELIASLEEQPQKVQVPTVQVVKSDLQLAHEYLFGFTRPQEVHKAIEIYQRQANKPNPDPSVFNVLGILHEQGKGFQKDMGKAFKYFMKSADKGDPEGLYRVGQYLEKGYLNFKHYFDGLYANRDAQVRGGIQYYEKAAAYGHLNALTDLGFIYQKGVMHDNGSEYFIDPHPDHAKKYYQKAKKQQFPRAYNNLGNLIICQNASGADYQQVGDLQKGIKYLNKAKQLGCAKAYLNLGKCYMSGTGMPVNHDKARSLFRQAAELGEIQGRLEYIRSYIGTNLQEEETMSQLVETVRSVLVSNDKLPEALYLMGLLQEKGIGVPANKEASFHYVASAARQQYPPALTRLGDYYYSGHHVDKSYESARILYQKAAQHMDSQAFLNLAIMQEKGLITPGNSMGTAEELYQKAEELGNSNAVLMKGLKKEVNLTSNPTVMKAASQGNYNALKLLSMNQSAPTRSLYPDQPPQFKKLSTFYVKQSFPSKVSFTSYD